MDDNILEVNYLKKYFKVAAGVLNAVDDISFKVRRGTTMGLVGESGCGKSTTGRCILRLIEPNSGEIIFNEENILNYSGRKLRNKRKDMQIIFQDPFSSIDPRRTVYETIAEPIIQHRLESGRIAIESRILYLMETVGLSKRLINSYPHELDGGRLQRVGIARTLAVRPKFIVCDEPVSALDVSIQAQILNLLKQLQKNLGLTYIFITHDLSVVNYFSDEIMVMYLGKIVEKASTEKLFHNPIHPYTKALISAIPVPNIDYKKERILLRGEITSPINTKEGCRFANRCKYKQEQCAKITPDMREVSTGHFVACHLFP